MLSADVLERIARALPYPSFTLAETAVLVFGHLTELISDNAHHAHWIVGLSRWLSELGRREEALAAAEEAVSAYRGLAAARPDAFLPDLAMSLINQFVIHSGLGRQEEALATIEEAVSTYRQLAATWPDAFLTDFMAQLNNWSGVLEAIEREPEAAAARLAAMELNRRT